MSCDLCHEQDNHKVPATVTVIFGTQYGGSVDKVTELCDDHAGALTVAELVATGRPYIPPQAEKPPRLPQMFDFTVCPFCDKKCHPGVGVAVHVRHMHPEYFKPRIDWTQVTFDGKHTRYKK